MPETEPGNQTALSGTDKAPLAPTSLSSIIEVDESPTPPSRPVMFTKKGVKCGLCSLVDTQQKVICCSCGVAQHCGCAGVKKTDEEIVRSGNWLCLFCKEKSITESPSFSLGVGAIPKIKQTHFDQAARKSSESKKIATEDSNLKVKEADAEYRQSNLANLSLQLKDHASSIGLESTKNPDNSHDNAMTDEELLEAEHKLKMKRLRDQFDTLLMEEKIRHEKQKRGLNTGSKHSGSILDLSSLTCSEKQKEVDDWVPVPRPRNEKLEKRNSSGRNHHSQGGIDPSLRILNPRLSMDEFLETTAIGRGNENNIQLNQSQLQARWVIPKDLPVFSGDPRLWPQFISTFCNTNKQCGFTDEENIARLSKCLKGDALEHVRIHLMAPSGLPTALRLLKRLYGRPDLVFNAAVEYVRQAPPIKLEQLDTLVTFSSRLEQLCYTMKSAAMEDYLNNPGLLCQIVDKLPATLKMDWGKYRREIELENPIVNLETYSVWLTDLACTACSVATQPIGSFIDNSSEDNRRKSSTSNVSHRVAVHDSCEDNPKCIFCSKTGHQIVNCREFLKNTVKRRWDYVRRKRLCVGCLEKHWIRDCEKRKACGIQGCERPHNSHLHKPEESKEPSIRTIGNDKPEPEPSTVINLHGRNANITYQIIPVEVSDGHGSCVTTYAFLDSGSDITLIVESLANKIGLEGKAESLTLKWTNDVKRCEANSKMVNLFIQGTNEQEKYKLEGVRTVRKLKLPTQTIGNEQFHLFPHLAKTAINTYSDAQPHILIGLDNYQLLIARDSIEGAWDEPIAIRTKLGWTILGGRCNSGRNEIAEASVNLHTSANNQSLHDMVKSFFSFESLGIRVPNRPVESHEDTRAHTILKRTVHRGRDGHYEAGLLWKTDNVRLPESRNMARHRLECFERKLRKDPATAAEVKRQMTDYIDKGYLVELDATEANTQRDRTWFLPMFAVVNPNKPGKVRIVWDAAATVNETSLNSELLTGPDLLENLVGVLFKFREGRYAIGGDVEQMFHQVRIKHDDQDSQRCLWRENSNCPIRTFKMTVMTFGAACSPSIAQYVKNANAELFREEHCRAVEAVQRRHYVDDYIDSFDTEAECATIAKEVIEIHRYGGFHLRNFVSNSQNVLRTIPDRLPKSEIIKTLSEDDTKILGLRWHTKADTLQFKVDQTRFGIELLRGERTPTKRIVLRTVMMIFDPLGFVSYYLVRGKILVKAIWRTGIDWDDYLTPTDLKNWRIWIDDLLQIEDVRLPRWYFTEKSEDETYELHTFVDASENAAAAVSYVVRVAGLQREVAFVSAKTKVAPNRPISIPRMELQASVLGARLANTIKSHHSIQFRTTTYWLDSMNVLYWITSPRKYRQFVAFRIGEILETTNVPDWRWLPTHLNPADIATKWKSSSKREVPQCWFNGPEFLKRDEREWPKNPNLPLKYSDEDEELDEVTCNLTSMEQKHDMRPDLTRFSKYERVVRVQAYTLRFFYHRRPVLKSVTQQEFRESEAYLIRSVQQEMFPKEYFVLKRGDTIDKRSGLKQYSPFLDQHSILRMRSRLENADYLSFEQRFPVILPRHHQLTDLIVDYWHRKFQHQNHATVLNELKQRYIIPRLRAKVKSIRSKCPKCRIENSKAEAPEMAPLPQARLAVHLRPFTHTGLDYFGPVNIKIGRRHEKRWGALFTCLTTRAIHLEVVSSLSADSCILALRSFICRRGQPEAVYCDNGTNFHGAEHELRKAFKTIEPGLQDRYGGIRWSFNPPSAPHMGGAWERLVRSVKCGLRASLHEKVPTEEALRSALAEIEAIINSRPLTYVETDSNTLESLTPNHFLLGSSGGVKPAGCFSDDSAVLRQAWKEQQRIGKIFWKRWTSEYLPEISARTKWFDPIDPIVEGDVVAIVNPDVPHSWQLGRIERIIRSRDGAVRQADVQTGSGIYRRPAARLAVLLKNEPKDDDNKMAIRRKLRVPNNSSAGGSVADGFDLSTKIAQPPN